MPIKNAGSLRFLTRQTARHGGARSCICSKGTTRRGGGGADSLTAQDRMKMVLPGLATSPKPPIQGRLYTRLRLFFMGRDQNVVIIVD